jgi:aminoglycoside phosphotransferase (APT) family kinase protein
MTGIPGLDVERFARWFDGACPGEIGGPVTGRLLAGGKSNLTYEVSSGNRTWVVRRPPLGHVLATAHDMGREYQVISALRDSAVPVPLAIALCADPGVLGAPFYVMSKVNGVAYRSDAQIAVLGPQRTRAIAGRMTDTLADLHAVDYEAAGLSSFGRPAGFLPRQVRRWKKQLDASRSREVPGIDELHALLAAAADGADGGPATIVHGDYRLDNLLVDPSDKIAAVVDWEMATIADPLTDVGLLIVYQRLGELGDGPLASQAPGYPAEADVLERYALRSGRDLSDLGFHIALASFKLAVIMEGIYYRYTHGQTVGIGFQNTGTLAGRLIGGGIAALKGRGVLWTSALTRAPSRCGQSCSASWMPLSTRRSRRSALRSPGWKTGGPGRRCRYSRRCASRRGHGGCGTCSCPARTARG